MVNETRVVQAHRALRIQEGSYRQSGEENVTDLLTNLMHFCEYESVDFDACLLAATLHYDAETIGGKGG